MKFNVLREIIADAPKRALEKERENICKSIMAVLEGDPHKKWARVSTRYVKEMTDELTAAGFRVKPASENDGSIMVDW